MDNQKVLNQPLSFKEKLYQCMGYAIAHFLHWCRCNPSQTMTAALVIFLHIGGFYFIYAHKQETLVLKPKGKIVIKTVSSKPISKPLKQSEIASPLPSVATASVAASPEPIMEQKAALESEKPAATKKKPVKSEAKEKKEPKVEKPAKDKKKAEKVSKVEPVKEKKTDKPVKNIEKAKVPEKSATVEKAVKQPPIEKQLSVAPETNAKQQKLLAEIEANLSKVGSSTALTMPALNLSAAPKLMNELNIDAASIGEANGLTADQMGYSVGLVNALKLKLKLPEMSEVTIRLTLLREGKVSKVEIVSSKSILNRRYVENELPRISFPPFENHFGTERDRSFLIIMRPEA